jgi:phage FluMu protein Com
MSRETAPHRSCAVCGRLFQKANPTYKTCGSPRCVRINRANASARGKAKARGAEKQVEQRRTRETLAYRADRARAKRREDVFITDIKTRRGVISHVANEMRLGATEADSVVSASRRFGEPAGVVISIWRSRDGVTP